MDQTEITLSAPLTKQVVQTVLLCLTVKQAYPYLRFTVPGVIKDLISKIPVEVAIDRGREPFRQKLLYVRVLYTPVIGFVFCLPKIILLLRCTILVKEKITVAHDTRKLAQARLKHRQAASPLTAQNIVENGASSSFTVSNL
jgi:hypothetical protein